MYRLVPDERARNGTGFKLTGKKLGTISAGKLKTIPNLWDFEVLGVDRHMEALRQRVFSAGEPVQLVPGPTNEDPDAIMVWDARQKFHVGYVPKELAPELLKQIRTRPVRAIVRFETWSEGKRSGLDVLAVGGAVHVQIAWPGKFDPAPSDRGGARPADSERLHFSCAYCGHEEEAFWEYKVCPQCREEPDKPETEIWKRQLALLVWFGALVGYVSLARKLIVARLAADSVVVTFVHGWAMMFAGPADGVVVGDILIATIIALVIFVPTSLLWLRRRLF